MSEGIAFCIVLFFALYGVICLLRRFCLCVLRPEKGLPTFSLAYLYADTRNTEQIVRYFRAKAEREDVLLLVDNGVTTEEKQVLERLCDGRRDIRFISAEKIVEDNCIYGEDTI